MITTPRIVLRRTGLFCLVLVSCLGLGIPSARSSPATDSTIHDINDGVVDLSFSVAYQTAHVFRGVKQADDVMVMKLKTQLGAGPVDLSLGARSILPYVSQNGGIDEPSELNLFGLVRFDLLGLVQAEAGVTYYAFPSADQPRGVSPDSVELVAGLRLPVVLPLLTRLYYDTSYKNVTLEAQTHWRQPILGDRLEFEIQGRAGYVHAGDDDENVEAALAGARTLVEREPIPLASSFARTKDDRIYYGAGAAVSSKLTKYLKIGANLNWAGTTGEYVFDNRRDDETLYGGLTLTLGL